MTIDAGVSVSPEAMRRVKEERHISLFGQGHNLYGITVGARHGEGRFRLEKWGDEGYAIDLHADPLEQLRCEYGVQPS